MYRKYVKRILDFTLSLIALIVLAPLLLVLSVVGTIAMKGNPFFLQLRPGKNEKCFKLIKFRTMSNEKDVDGKLLPDEKRLNRYGRWLRATSLDELPELINILFGQMSIVGPRPLLIQYLPLYNEHQARRHKVTPGLTGYAQVNGRNALSWEERFDMDVWYVDNVCFCTDVKIVLDTIRVVFNKEGITSSTSETMEDFMGTSREV